MEEAANKLKAELASATSLIEQEQKTTEKLTETVLSLDAQVNAHRTTIKFVEVERDDLAAKVRSAYALATSMAGIHPRAFSIFGLVGEDLQRTVAEHRAETLTRIAEILGSSVRVR